MASASYTNNQLTKAQRLAEMVPTLPTARSKQTGITYVIVPSSDDPEHKGHLTNGLECSCKMFKRKDACSHALAVTMADRRVEAERIAAAQKLRAEHGGCKVTGCLRTASGPSKRCAEHFQALLDELGY